MRGALGLALGLVLALAMLTPASALAEVQSQTYSHIGDLYPGGDANATIGPAIEYPSTIQVPFVPGLITKVTATLYGFGSGEPEDADIALVGPDGTTVMLMSDACGTGPLENDRWTFDDEAPVPLSHAACSTNQVASFKPSDFTDPGLPDDMAVQGGPAGPYLSSLAAFDGLIPGGAWRLYALDDQSGTVGFAFSAWSVSISVETPAPVVEAPGAPTAPAGGTVTTAPPAPTHTGRRARALARCMKKPAGKARRHCRAHARKLPV
jgi:hypothetical protein